MVQSLFNLSDQVVPDSPTESYATRDFPCVKKKKKTVSVTPLKYVVKCSLMYSHLTPALPRKIGPWTYSTFLSRDKGPAQSVLSLLLYVECLCLFQTYYMMFCSS